MPTLNEETGFYRGNIHMDGEVRGERYVGKVYVGECVPTAVANYLLLHEIPKDTIEKVLKAMEKSPEYDDITGGFNPFDVPKAVERALRTHIDKDIQVTLYTTLPESKIPDEKKSHVKHNPKGTRISVPAIAFTNFEGYQHLWVAAGNPPARIDNDGNAYESLFLIGGHLEIKGL